MTHKEILAVLDKDCLASLFGHEPVRAGRLQQAADRHRVSVCRFVKLVVWEAVKESEAMAKAARKLQRQQKT